MELEHLLDVVDIEDVGWFFVRFLALGLDSKLNWEAIRYLNDLSLSITCAQESSNGDVSVVVSCLSLEGVVEEVWQYLRGDDAVLLLGSTQAKIEVRLNSVSLYSFHVFPCVLFFDK